MKEDEVTNSTPSQSPAFLLNYAAVVRRCADMHRAKQHQEEEGAPTVTGGQVQPQPARATEDDDHDRTEADVVATSSVATPSNVDLQDRAPRTSVLMSPKVVAAKPYVPSYLAALKAQSPTVMLEGVPVNVNKGHRQTNTEWCSSTNVSTSFFERETESSWADDDASFIASINRATEGSKSTQMFSVESPSLGHSTRSHNRQQARPRGGNTSGNSQPNGSARRGGHGDQRGGGQRQASGGQYHTHGEYAAQHYRAGRGGQHRQQQQQQQQRQRQRGGDARERGSPTDISGGRFDVLTDPSVMRHL